MRGVQHFMVYTTSDMSPASAEVYQPYIDAGLVTRVHFNVPAEKCWFDLKPDAQQSILMNDCLYRSRGGSSCAFSPFQSVFMPFSAILMVLFGPPELNMRFFHQEPLGRLVLGLHPGRVVSKLGCEAIPAGFCPVSTWTNT